MNLRSFGSFAFITGVLALLLVFFITGPMISDKKQQVEKRGVFASVGAEFSGKAAQERQSIDGLAAFNRVAFIGGIALVVIGAGARLAGSVNP